MCRGEHPLSADQCSSAEVLVQRVDEGHVPAPLPRGGVRATDHSAAPSRMSLHATGVFVGVVGPRRRRRSGRRLEDLDVTRTAIWWGEGGIGIGQSRLHGRITLNIRRQYCVQVTHAKIRATLMSLSPHFNFSLININLIQTLSLVFCCAIQFRRRPA